MCRQAWGYDGGYIGWVSSECVVHKCSNGVQFVTIGTDEDRFLQSSGFSVGKIAANPFAGIVAFEVAQTPSPRVLVYSMSAEAVVTSFTDVAEMALSAIDISRNGHLLVMVSGEPDLQLTVCDLRKGVSLVTCKLHHGRCKRVLVNPNNPDQILTVADHAWSLWQLERTDIDFCSIFPVDGSLNACTQEIARMLAGSGGVDEARAGANAGAAGTGADAGGDESGDEAARIRESEEDKRAMTAAATSLTLHDHDMAATEEIFRFELDQTRRMNDFAVRRVEELVALREAAALESERTASARKRSPRHVVMVVEDHEEEDAENGMNSSPGASDEGESAAELGAAADDEDPDNDADVEGSTSEGEGSSPEGKQSLLDSQRGEGAFDDIVNDAYDDEDAEGADDDQATGGMRLQDTALQGGLDSVKATIESAAWAPEGLVWFGLSDGSLVVMNPMLALVIYTIPAAEVAGNTVIRDITMTTNCVVCCTSSGLLLWINRAKRTLLHRVMVSQELRNLSTLLYSPTYETMVLGSSDGHVFAAFLPKGPELETPLLTDGKENEESDPDGESQALVERDGGGIDAGAIEFYRLTDFHSGCVRSCAFLMSSGGCMVTAGMDGTLRIWEYAGGAMLRRHNVGVPLTAVATCASLIAVGSKYGVIRIYESQEVSAEVDGDGQVDDMEDTLIDLRLVRRIKVHYGASACLKFSDDGGSVLCCGSASGELVFLSGATGYRLQGFVTMPGPIHSLTCGSSTVNGMNVQQLYCSVSYGDIYRVDIPFASASEMLRAHEEKNSSIGRRPPPLPTVTKHDRDGSDAVQRAYLEAMQVEWKNAQRLVRAQRAREAAARNALANGNRRG